VSVLIRHDYRVRGLLRHGNPVGRYAKDVCALQRHQPIGFRKLAMVADRHRHSAELGLPYGDAEIAGFEEQVLGAP
jgi:hypothetical protein